MVVRRRQMCRLSTVKLLFPLVIILSFFFAGLLLGPKPYSQPPTTLPPPMTFEDDPEDIFISSAYFYPISESLGNNAVAVVFSGNFEILTKYPVLQVLATNKTDNMVRNVVLQRITPHNVCPWISIFFTVQLIPDLSTLSLMLGNKFHRIPVQRVSYKKREVVTCISPLFANEQWQYLVLAAHLYRSFMHVYVRSMVEPVYKLMLEYQKAGYLLLEPWLRLNLSSIPLYEFNPNINVEFRNQAAAQTDCLLKYKESAEFISFMDLDDILIPRLAGTYKEEFELLFNMEEFKEVNKRKKRFERIPLEMEEEEDPLPESIKRNPWWRREKQEKKIAFLHFRKENVHVESHYDPRMFSLTRMFSSMYFKRKNETGKMVTRPKYFNHTWIHWPIQLPDGFIRYDVPVEKNVISHLKILDEDLGPINMSIMEPEYLEQQRKRNSQLPLIEEKIIQEIQADFERMKRSPEFSRIWSTLPRRPFYLNLVADCFNHTFYRYHYGNRFDRIKCPGPDRCRLPEKPGILCSNANAEYFSSSGGSAINVHFAQFPHFVIKDGCNP